MSQRMFNLSKWSVIRDGEELYYDNRKIRQVVLDVNSSDDVRLYISQASDQVENSPQALEDDAAGRRPNPGQVSAADTVRFLALVRGRDRVEFTVEGPFALLAEGGDCFVYTVDGMDAATRVTAPLIYTRIANRKDRNPHLDMLMRQSKLNELRMLQRLEGEIERRLAARDAEKESYVEQRKIAAPSGRASEEVSEQVRALRARIAELEAGPVVEAESSEEQEEPAPKRGKKAPEVTDA